MPGSLLVVESLLVVAPSSSQPKHTGCPKFANQTKPIQRLVHRGLVGCLQSTIHGWAAPGASLLLGLPPVPSWYPSQLARLERLPSRLVLPVSMSLATTHQSELHHFPMNPLLKLVEVQTSMSIVPRTIHRYDFADLGQPPLPRSPMAMSEAGSLEPPASLVGPWRQAPKIARMPRRSPSPLPPIVPSLPTP